MSDNVKFDVCRADGTTTILVEGEFSLYVAQELRSLLKDAIASRDEVSVDLTRALYIDTAILMCLVAAQRELSSSGRKLKVVVSDDSHPHYVLKVSRMNELLEVVIAGT